MARLIATLSRTFSEMALGTQLKAPAVCHAEIKKLPLKQMNRWYTPLTSRTVIVNPNCVSVTPSLLQRCQDTVTTEQKRTVTMEVKQWREGRVISRFYRLNWGGWIRTIGGRKKRLYQKSPKERFRLKQHVFVTRKQCKLLDKLVTDQWKEPKYYVDTIEYQPYHKRTNSLHFPNHRKFYP